MQGRFKKRERIARMMTWARLWRERGREREREKERERKREREFGRNEWGIKAVMDEPFLSRLIGEKKHKKERVSIRHCQYKEKITCTWID